MKKTVALFLYTEIATYFTTCCNELQKHAEVHVVRYPINKEAPFEFDSNTNNVHYYNRKEYSLEQLKKLVASIAPDIIFCSGWIDKDYLKICSVFKKKTPTVLCMDTKWKGSFKQKLARIVAPFTIKPIFSDAWVPGMQQLAYAKKLGFPENKIHLGYYCADTEYFNKYYQANKERKLTSFPKKFLFVGRYYNFKGITDLWDAFIQLQNENPNEWELWCLGTGDIAPIQHPKIKHFGFIQPTQLASYIANAGIFVLPSRFEPWAVVVHEYAAAGFPLLISNEVGAAESFLINGQNGFTFVATNINDLKEKMKRFMSLSNESLNLMSEKSVELAGKLNPTDWAQTALRILKNAN